VARCCAGICVCVSHLCLFREPRGTSLTVACGWRGAGRSGGVDTLLVLSGCTDRASAERARGTLRPHFGVGSLGDFAQVLESAVATRL